MLQQRQPLPRTHRLAHTWLRRDRPHWWLPAVLALTIAYGLFTLLVLAGSALTELDRDIYDLHLVPVDSSLRLPVQLWVFLGQRAPATIIAGVVAAWCAYRARTSLPLVMYALGVTGFVSSVLVLKWATGRVGPRYTDVAHTVWDGGNIFPSGHVTGAVVMYGIIALVARPVYRRMLALAAVVISITVGLGTTALNLHWFSDVIGAWMNGALVLLVTWAIAPAVHARLLARWAQLRAWHTRMTRGAEPLPFDTTALRRTSGAQ